MRGILWSQNLAGDLGLTLTPLCGHQPTPITDLLPTGVYRNGSSVPAGKRLALNPDVALLGSGLGLEF